MEKNLQKLIESLSDYFLATELLENFSNVMGEEKIEECKKKRIESKKELLTLMKVHARAQGLKDVELTLDLIK